jgi:hypothetical protein
VGTAGGRKKCSHKVIFIVGVPDNLGKWITLARYGRLWIKSRASFMGENMDWFAEFFTLKFLVGVLVVGVAVNIFSHYLIPPIDSLFGFYFVQMENTNRKKEKTVRATA